MNVLGFMNRKNDLHPCIFEQSVHTEVVMACFEEFSKTLKKKTVVAMDNASVHTSEEFEECLPQWKKKGLLITSHSPYKKSKSLISRGPELWADLYFKPRTFSCYALCQAV